MAFPFWAIIAIGGHLANGAAFVIDKSLLTSSFKRAGTYAATVGALSALALIVLFFGAHLPASVASWAWIATAGITFILALWAFFSALAAGEASRVVPIVGSLIPILTFLGTSTVLGERLSRLQGIGFGLLILATIILAGGAAKSRLSQRARGMAVLSASLYAISFLAIKIGYETEGFTTTFGISRAFAALTAIAILCIDRKALAEIKSLFARKDPKKGVSRMAAILILVGQTLGAIGFILVQYAISLGSAAIINALQAVQYAFLVLVAFTFAKHAPRLLGEDLRLPTVIRKSVAILIVAIGLWFVVS